MNCQSKNHFPSHPYAQTNIQLYNQLYSLNINEEKSIQVKKAYDLCIKIFSGRYRANGKPFISHLVGTASIIAEHGGCADDVIAGLLHAIYSQSQLQLNKSGDHYLQTQMIENLMGEKINRLLIDYNQLPWDSDSIATIEANCLTCSSLQKRILLIRLANELEDRLDLGMSYCKKLEKNDAKREGSIIKISSHLGHIKLAKELSDIYRSDVIANIPDKLVSNHKKSYSYNALPVRKKLFSKILMKSVLNKIFRSN